MKRMSEVFELPVNSKHVYVASDVVELVECAKDDVFKAAAHAINNVDALADALEAALPALKYNRSISDSADKVYLDAVSALAAYRGTK